MCSAKWCILLFVFFSWIECNIWRKQICTLGRPQGVACVVCRPCYLRLQCSCSWRCDLYIANVKSWFWRKTNHSLWLWWNRFLSFNCNIVIIIAGIFFPTVRALWLLGGHVTSNNDTVSHQNLGVGNIAKFMTSEGNSALFTHECWPTNTITMRFKEFPASKFPAIWQITSTLVLSVSLRTSH